MKNYEVGVLIGRAIYYAGKNHAIDEKGFPLCKPKAKGYMTYRKMFKDRKDTEWMSCEVNCQRCLDKINSEGYEPLENELSQELQELKDNSWITVICSKCDGNGCEQCNTTGSTYILPDGWEKGL